MTSNDEDNGDDPAERSNAQASHERPQERAELDWRGDKDRIGVAQATARDAVLSRLRCLELHRGVIAVVVDGEMRSDTERSGDGLAVGGGD